MSFRTLVWMVLLSPVFARPQSPAGQGVDTALHAMRSDSMPARPADATPAKTADRAPARPSDSTFSRNLDDIVISGTLRPVRRLESPVAVEVYTAQFFRMNPVPSVFEAMQGVNGVRPQINCNICATGDIHINGLEGPYTMVTIDGMPIVSSLSSVYGLFGIPAQLIERSISKTGMPEMAGQNGPENDGAKISLSRRVSSLRPTA